MMDANFKKYLSSLLAFALSQSRNDKVEQRFGCLYTYALLSMPRGRRF